MTREEQCRLFATMTAIRRFEETVWDLYRRGEMPGLAHLSIGQEAVAAGVCSALRNDDYIVSTHRGHGHCIAKGTALDVLMAEMLGKQTGVCKGRGGTMHFADLSHGNVGAMGIVGAGVGLGAGLALACALGPGDRVAVSFCGDGAMNEGVVFEAMNLAAVWRLPYVIVCENNQYGEYTAAASVSAGDRLSARAEAFGIPTQNVDGMDVVAVHGATAAAVARARNGGGPSFIECEAYRFSGHHVGDLEKYRTRDEVTAWRQRDPIDRLAGELAEQGASEAELDAIRADAEDRVAAAVAFARESAFPDPRDIEEHVYG